MKSHTLGFVWLGIAVLFLAAAQGGMQWESRRHGLTVRELEERVRTLEHALECVQGEAGEVRRRVDRDHWVVEKLIHRQRIEGTEPQLAEPMKEGR